MTVPARELRAWANGDYPTEAAVELLVRAKGGRFARESQPWIERPWPSSALRCVDWDRLHDEVDAFSGGERRLLNIAVSMGTSKYPVDLSPAARPSPTPTSHPHQPAPWTANPSPGPPPRRSSWPRAAGHGSG